MLVGFRRIPVREDVDPDPPRLFRSYKRIVEHREDYKNFSETIKLYQENFWPALSDKWIQELVALPHLVALFIFVIGFSSVGAEDFYPFVQVHPGSQLWTPRNDDFEGPTRHLRT